MRVWRPKPLTSLDVILQLVPWTERPLKEVGKWPLQSCGKNARNIKVSFSLDDPLSFSSQLQNFVSDILLMRCFISCGVLLKKAQLYLDLNKTDGRLHAIIWTEGLKNKAWIGQSWSRDLPSLLINVVSLLDASLPSYCVFRVLWDHRRGENRQFSSEM